MFLAKITVTLRKAILDPQGKAVEHGLHALGLKAIERVRIGKHIEFAVKAGNRDEAERVTREACEKLLANPVMEDFSITIEEVRTPAHV